MLKSAPSRIAVAVAAALAVTAGIVIAIDSSPSSGRGPTASSAPTTVATAKPCRNGCTTPTLTPEPPGPTALLPPLTSAPAPPAVASLPQPVVDVTSVGAVGDGHTDSTDAIAAAVTRAQGAGGGTVYFPAGTFVVGQQGHGSSIRVESGPAVTLAGAGMDKTTIVESRPGKDLLNVRVDGVVVEDLTLDTRTNGAGHCLGVVANNTTLQRAHIVSGSRTFALYYAGPPGAKPTAATYNTGNKVLDTVVEDGVKDDGFSFSFQRNGLIRDIVHRGSRLALYVDRSVMVDGYRYLPGTQSGATNGFWITTPSDHLTIANFVTTGNGGIIGPNQGDASRMNTAVEIDGERMLNPGFKLLIGDVSGLTIRNSDFGGNDVRFNPSVEATNVIIANGSLSAVTFAQSRKAVVHNVDFQNDVYRPVTPEPNRPGTATFDTLSGGDTTFMAEGGMFMNQAGAFQSGANTHFKQSVPGA